MYKKNKEKNITKQTMTIDKQIINGPIKSLDAFTGLGGMTHALSHIVDPICYCDSAQESQNVLQKLMIDNKIPQRPICPNITQLEKKWIKNNCNPKTS